MSYLQKNYGGVCRHHGNRFLAVLLNQGRIKTVSDRGIKPYTNELTRTCIPAKSWETICRFLRAL